MAQIDDFDARNGLNQITLLELWQWSEEQFLTLTQGSPMRRTGYIGFLRNVAIALGNATASQLVTEALQPRLGTHGEILDDHIMWAIKEQRQRLGLSI